MNALLLRLQPRLHKLTVDEFRLMGERGVFAEARPMELLDGALYEMADDGPRTIDWNVAINAHLVRTLDPARYAVVPDKMLAVSEHWGPKPDFWIFDPNVRTEDITGRNVLLVIEVSDTTMATDRGSKREGYEQGGVREYWIADCAERRLLVHRLGADGRYGEPTPIAFDEMAQALLIPELSLRLADLPRLS